ncbi:MAG: hypothetical protein R3C10_04830 [Pirellulales bacterium]|nr:hypothetical protein [Planctomycetales bacterium]
MHIGKKPLQSRRDLTGDGLWGDTFPLALATFSFYAQFTMLNSQFKLLKEVALR